MPTYEHKCQNVDCGYEWEDEYSIKSDPPKICPECKEETAMRIISGGAGKGIVVLAGHELSAKLKEDTIKLKKELSTNENTYANFVGEDRYQGNKIYNEDVKQKTKYFEKQFRRVK